MKRCNTTYSNGLGASYSPVNPLIIGNHGDSKPTGSEQDDRLFALVNCQWFDAVSCATKPTAAFGHMKRYVAWRN